ncbi:MopE-related protein [Flavobacterium sp. 25HG05S-40]|uniref:MopE-related protein n=1 Tax=Flavobacterium sp. 25HG05S-40 TaxID=3458682 RepID=UPI004044E29E
MTITVVPQLQWYLDADGDHYYTGTAVSSCTSPGTGYTTTVTGGDDCNDALASINPGATEICYNNLDDNCNGTSSEGCASVVVNMTPSYHNTTLVSLAAAIPAIAYSYPGAVNLKYRFSIRNTTTNVTAPDIIQISRYVTIPAIIHTHGASYTITASAVINEEIVPFAGNTITVNSPAVPVITLSTSSCGATLTTLASSLTANPGLNATGYTFRIRLNDSNPSPTYGFSPSATRFVGANTFTGFPLQYGSSYRVAVQYTFTDPVSGLPVDSGYGAECVVNTPSIPVTSMASPSCGGTVSALNANMAARAASYATGYRFRIRLFSDNGPTPTYYQTAVLPSRFSSLTAFQGITIAYSTEYAISVQYSVLNGATTEWSAFGPDCKVTTPFFPTTSLVPSQCGLLTPTSLTQQLNITPYPGFPNYKVLLEEIDGETVVTSEEREIVYSNFKLSDFAIAQLGKNYNISVAIKLNGVFGDYSTACDVFTAAESKALIQTPFTATAYPNPFANNFMLDVKTSSQSSVSVKVYDMVGRLIEQRDVSVSEMESTTIGNQYPSGVYNVVVAQEDTIQTVRVVKR